MEDKIYVVCNKSNRIRVFQDEVPFDALPDDEIVISNMDEPYDIVASKASRSIFVSNGSVLGGHLLKIQMLGKNVSRQKVSGKPDKLINSNQLFE